MTQTEMILDHLKQNGCITAVEALNEYGCLRLSARIWELRHEGVNIKRIDHSTTNRFGNPARYAVYYLEAADG